MNDSERDELLIEMRTDVKHIKDWIPQHEQTHRDDKSTRTRWTIFFTGTLVALLSKIVFWK